MVKAATRITRTDPEVQGRLPSPPRTPSFDPSNPGAVSGTRLIPAAPRDGEFPAEEPSSFDTRRTPVVPAKWPVSDDESRPTRPPPEGPTVESGTPEVDGTAARDASAAAPAPVSQAVSISLVPPANGEPDFFETPPQYSIAPPFVIAEPPTVPASPLRTMLSKLLFTTIACAVVILLSYEVSVALHVPALDPRRLLDWSRPV